MTRLKDFKLQLSDMTTVAENLSRPESVVVTKDGTLFCSDTRGVATRISPNGEQRLLGNTGGEPNGLSMDRHGNLYSANFAKGRFDKVSPDGRVDVLLDEIGGLSMPPGCNYIWIDAEGKEAWMSVSGTNPNFFEGFANCEKNGFIIHWTQNGGANVVAEGLAVANEVRVDPSGNYLYAVETAASRLLRWTIRDGKIENRTQFGPNLPGLPDGFAFDSEGNVWVTLVTENVLGIIPHDGGDFYVVADFGNAAAARTLRKKLQTPGQLTIQDFIACGQCPMPFMTSIAFGGPDLKTCYLGSHTHPKITSFRSPVAGYPLPHWLTSEAHATF